MGRALLQGHCRVAGVPIAGAPGDAWLSPDAILQIATGIAAGLAILHSRGWSTATSPQRTYS